MDNLFIRELDLSSRALNCLLRNGITNLKELMSLKEDDLIKMRNMGVKSVKEIMDFFEDALLANRGRTIHDTFQKLGLQGFEEIADDVRKLYKG